MKTKAIVFLLLTSSVLMSCLSTGGVYKTAKSKDLNPLLLSTPTLYDVDVSNTKVVCEFDISRFDKNAFESYKDIAIYRACESAGCDIIVEPQFDISSKGTKVHVKIKGFPATYKNFRTFSPADSSVLILHKIKLE